MKERVTRGLLWVWALVLIVLAVLGPGGLMKAQSGGPMGFYVEGLIPSSAATVATDSIFIDAIVLSNVTGGDVTVTINDRSTGCNAGVCAVVPTAMVVKAGSIYSIPLYRVRATRGLTWVASSANAIVGRIVGSK